MKTFFKKLLAGMAAFGLMAAPMAPTATAATIGPDYISSFIVSPSDFNPSAGGTTQITFDLNISSTVRVKVVERDAPFEETLVNDVQHSSGPKTFVWTGRAGNSTTGAVLPNGNYVIQAFAIDSAGTIKDVAYQDVTISNTTVTPVDVTNLTVSPSPFDPRDGETTMVNYTMNQAANVTLKIYRGTTVSTTTLERTLMSNVARSAGTDSVIWDGRNDFGTIVNDGIYTVRVEATNAGGTDVMQKTVEVKTETNQTDGPEIINVTVSPREFDPSDNETTRLRFNVTEDAYLTVVVKNSFGSVVDTFSAYSDDFYQDGILHSIIWDGDNEPDGTYYFEIEAENSNGFDRETISVEIDENNNNGDVIINLDVTPDNNWDPRERVLRIEFDLTEDVEELHVDAVRGSEVIEIIDRGFSSDGSYDYTWDGEDEFGRLVREGIWTIRVSTEDPDDTATETVEVDYDGGTNSGDCGGYLDTDDLRGTELCDAIEWGTDEGIWHGDPTGFFRPYDPINRAETIKVTLEAFDVSIMNSDGTDLGFRDVDPGAWYMPYARTAKFYGMLHGYLHSTEARLGNRPNRAELLKFILHASDAFTSWELPGYERSYYADVDPQDPTHDWFFDLAGANHEYDILDARYDAGVNGAFLRPGDLVNRGEVAVALYRLNNAGLLD